MKKVAERLTKIANTKTTSKKTKKIAGEMEIAKRVLAQDKRIVALEEEVKNLKNRIEALT